MADLYSKTVDVSYRILEEYQIIKFSGNLVYENMETVKSKVYEIFKPAKGYILEMDEVAQIDSTGFGLIFNIVKRKPEDSAIVAVVTDPYMAELFNITKIDTLVPMIDSIQEAVKKIESN